MIIISKDSVRLEYFEDGQKKTLLIDEEITKYKDHIVYIDEDVTVRDLFVHLGKNVDLINTVFDSSLGGYDFQAFLDESMEEPNPDDLLKYAVFEHSCNIDSDELLHDVRFVIIGVHPVVEGMVPYSIELSPINAYSNLTVKIDPKFEIVVTEEANGEHIEMILFESNKPMTLYEVISSLLYEVSCYGTPDMRKEIFDEMKNQVLLKMQEEGELTPTMIQVTIDEEIKELEEDLERSISAEDYETSAGIRDKINELRRKSVGQSTNKPNNKDVRYKRK